MQPLFRLAISIFPSWLPVYDLLLVGAIVLSFGIARWFGGFDPVRVARTRFRWGIPWGTLSISGFVLFVYLFVQNGITYPNAPTVIPFRAWSYFSPTGIVMSPFTHANRGHVTGNIVGTLTVGVLAEYLWSHYPEKRTSNASTSLGLGFVPTLTHPSVRILAFVVGSLVVGLLSGVFSLGPTIGFSGVVFAYAGFTLMRYPLGTVLVLLSGRVLSLVYQSIRNPTVTQAGQPQFVTPWWAGISLQGHALGLFIGALCGIYLVRRRSVRPNGLRLWSGVLIFAVFEGMWAMYIPLGGSQFKLFRAIGAAAVFLLAALLTIAVRSSDQPLFGRSRIQYKDAALSLVAVLLVIIAAVAVPYNLFTVPDRSSGITDQNSIQVRGYTIAYAEGIPNQYISDVEFNALGETTNVKASGVIVVNDQQEIWWQEISKDRLGFDHKVAVRVGGIGWRETVLASRTTWKVVGNHSVYTVQLEHDDERTHVFTSQPARAEPTIAGRNVTFVPGETFSFRVTRNGTVLGQADIPERNEAVSAGGLTLVRMKNRLYAMNNKTRVRIAKYVPPKK